MSKFYLGVLTGVKAVLICTGIFLFTFLVSTCVDKVLSKGLYEIVDIKDLGPEYDNKKVAVIAWGVKLTRERGRMGSKYLEFTVRQDGNSVRVFYFYRIFNGIGNRFVIQGVYHVDGRFGGYNYSHFIDSNDIRRYW